MKFTNIITTVAVAFCALIATAQAELKIASVNVTELYTLFYKRFNTEETLKQQQEQIRAEIQQREEKLRTLQEEDQQIQRQYDPSLSEAQVRRLREQHQVKMNEIQAAQQELQTYVQRRQRAFQEMFRREMTQLFAEVQQAITDITTQGGYDLVIDSSATNSTTGIRIFPHVKSTFDITPEVLRHLNSGAPEGFDPRAELQRLYGAATPGAAPAAAPAN
ncbi:MAG: OmpH family outer membrane protein [Akkermansia sp.]|nr:OmpH family outer membrane protein [Akkermansia sp.]